MEHTASVVPSTENLSALRACGRENANCAIGSGSNDVAVRSGLRSTTVMRHPEVSDTGDVGGGGNELGVTVACGSNPSTGEDILRLRLLLSAAVWYSCVACVALAAGALLEKNMPNAPAAADPPDVDVLLVCPGLGLCACSPETAAVTPARAAESAIPLRAFIPLSTLPPIFTAALPRSAWDMESPNFDPAPSEVGTGWLVCACPGVAAEGAESCLESGET